MAVDDVNADASARQTLIDLSIESWRFAKLFGRVLNKLDADESPRYVSQLRYFLKKLDDGLQSAGLRFVNLEGHPYDLGMAITALNLEEFGANEQLVVDQMVEPVLMGDHGLVKAGSALLRRASQQ